MGQSMETFCRGTVTLPKRDVALTNAVRTIYDGLLEVTGVPRIRLGPVSLPATILGSTGLYPAAGKWKTQPGLTEPLTLLRGDNNNQATDLKVWIRESGIPRLSGSGRSADVSIPRAIYLKST